MPAPTVNAGPSAPARTSSLIRFGVVTLLALLSIMLFASVRQESGLGDETMHLFGGYEYWKHADFGRNPEHPPFAKMLAALPLLPMHLHEPAPVPIPFFKAQDGANSSQFLYSQDAEAMLMRGRMVILLFSVLLGLLVFLAGREMFSPLVGLLALGLFVFEPTVLANGAIITTDMPLACLFFATVYAFYRYLQRPSWPRLALCCVACALAIATKHSGILILPTLALLALFDLLLHRQSRYDLPAPEDHTNSRRALHLAGALALIFLFAWVALWAVYGFRFAARPGALQMVPSLALYSLGLTPFKHAVIAFAAQHHLLPEAYLYGWVDVLLIPTRVGSFVLGRFFTEGKWSYLPVIFLIKTTVAVLLLLLLVPFTRFVGRRREALFLALPAILFALFSVSSKINLGVRHLLPLYPFCFVLAASAAVFMIRRYRFAWIGVTALLLLDLGSSLHAFPDYLVYANELFGGPSHIYRLAADSNADWGQGLKWTQRYLDQHPTSDCWVAHTSAPVVPADYYVHCKSLLNGFSRMIGTPVAPLPQTISGTVFIGTTDITGFQWGPGALNPYAAFRDGHPDAVLHNDIWVYHGTFDISLLAALNNALTAQIMLRQHQTAAALALAKTAADQFPQSADVQAVLGQTLIASGQPAEGQKALGEALRLAHAVEPAYQQPLIDQIEHPAAHP
jgi:4-amino-4-deoxy-L-arabinose transferase-like glycosyltransferase